MVRKPAANAGDMGSILGPGRSHMPQSGQACVPQLLSLCSTAWEQQLLSPHAATTEACVPKSPCSAMREATTVRSHVAQLEHTETKFTATREKPQPRRPSTAKNDNII